MSSFSSRWAYPTWIQDSEVRPFWEHVASKPESHVLYIAGLGFDPRMLLGMETVLKPFPLERRSCLLLSAEIDGVVADAQLNNLTIANLSEAQKILGSDIRPHIFPMFSGADVVIGPRQVNQFVKEFVSASPATEWVIDVSSLPRIIFIPLISMLLTQAERKRQEGVNQNLHVIVGDNADIDNAISGTGIDLTATACFGFSKSTESDSIRHIQRVWIPILGDCQEGNLRNVKAYIDPSVILPMVPFPARDPRRPDAVLTSHRILFEEFDVQIGDILYAGESNPFDVYQQILSVAKTYEENLQELGGANVIISPLSSKVQSIGACLAAHELKSTNHHVGVVQTIPTEYLFSNPSLGFGATRLQSLWLAGDGIFP